MDKLVFSYWQQGFDNAPALVKMCVKSLMAHHADWKIQLLDAETVAEWVDPIPIPEGTWNNLPLAHQSDIIRSQLLIKYGGVWADPTIWFARSMDDWLDTVMGSGLFLFSRPGRDRLISNWFIAAEQGNPLLSRLYQFLCDYWSSNEFVTIGHTPRWSISVISRILNRNILWPQLWLNRNFTRVVGHAPYMIYHYAFAHLVRRDQVCQKVWAQTPRSSADAPHALLRHGLRNPYTGDIEELLDGRETPLFKLTWKLGEDPVPADSVLAELCRRAEHLGASASGADSDRDGARCES